MANRKKFELRIQNTIKYPNYISHKVLVSEYRLPFKKSSENNRIFGSDSGFRLGTNLSFCLGPLGPDLSHLLISVYHFCDYAGHPLFCKPFWYFIHITLTTKALLAKIFPLGRAPWWTHQDAKSNGCQKNLTSVICESPVSKSSPIQDILLANMSMIPGKKMLNQYFAMRNWWWCNLILTKPIIFMSTINMHCKTWQSSRPSVEMFPATRLALSVAGSACLQ